MAHRWLPIIALVIPTQFAAAGVPTSEAIRASARKAAGFEVFQRLPDGIIYEGKAEFLGIPGTFRSRLAPDGRYVRVIEARGEQATGFDGTTRWARNFSGPVRHLEMEEADRERYLFGVLCQRWLADDGGFTAAVDPAATTDARVGLTLRHQDAGVVAKLYLTRSTWLPEQLVIPGALNMRVVEFSDIREVSGVRFPARVTIDPGAGGQWVAGERGAPARDGHTISYAPPTVGLGVKFDSGVAARLETRRMTEGLMLVRPAVNGKPSPWFVFDTGNGAATLMTTAAADRLDLPVFGGTTLRGTGKARMRFRQTAAFTLGPATVEKMVVGEMPQELADALTHQSGVEVGGIVGWDLLSRAVVEVDYRAGVISVHDPATYRPPAGASWEEIRFNARLPCVRGKFEGKHEGLFLFDTGHEGGVTLNAPAVRRLDLLAGRETTPRPVYGIGGTMTARCGTATELQVLGRKAKTIEAWFATEAEGLYSDPYTLGTFGLSVLGPGVVVLDYPNRRIAFVPNPDTGTMRLGHRP